MPFKRLNIRAFYKLLLVVLAFVSTGCGSQNQKFAFREVITQTDLNSVYTEADYHRAPRIQPVTSPQSVGIGCRVSALGISDHGEMYAGLSGTDDTFSFAQVIKQDRQGDLHDFGNVDTLLMERGIRRYFPVLEHQDQIVDRLAVSNRGVYFISASNLGTRILSLGLTGGRIQPHCWIPFRIDLVRFKDEFLVGVGYAAQRLILFNMQTNEVLQHDLSYLGKASFRLLHVDSQKNIYLLVPEFGSEPDDTSQLNTAGLRANEIPDRGVQVFVLNDQLDVVRRWRVQGGDEKDFVHAESIQSAELHSGELLIASKKGDLWLVPAASQVTQGSVSKIGTFHPGGPCSIACLFSPSGARLVMGAARIAKQPYCWLVFDIESSTSTSVSLDSDAQRLFSADIEIAGGSFSTLQGCGYVFGHRRMAQTSFPMLWRIDWP